MTYGSRTPTTLETVKSFMDKITAVQFVEAFSMLAEDGTYTVIGTTPASGTYHGRKDLFDRLIPVLAGFVVPPTLTWGKPIIDGDRAVLLASGSGVGPTGPYHQPNYAFVVRVKDGLFAEVTEFMDTMMLESAVFGRKTVTA